MTNKNQLNIVVTIIRNRVEQHQIIKLQSHNNALKIKYLHTLSALYYIILFNISQMLSKADWYKQMIKNGTKRFRRVLEDNQQKKPTVTLKCDIKLPSSHPFRSSQQIENNIPITHYITHQSSQQYPTLPYNQWPNSCIGLVLCEHHQNNQTLYVYGTGTLIHNILTSAQNVYCRRLNRQYTNFRFIVGVSSNKCSGIYDVMRLHYPKEYTMKNENYNFAVLQLYDDLSKSCGYVGQKTVYKPILNKLIVYGYIRDNKEGSFNLRQITKNEKSQQVWECCSGSGVFVKKNDNKYFIVGMHNSAKREEFFILSDKIRNIINQQTQFATVNLQWKKIDSQGCTHLSQVNWKNLKIINLNHNKIDSQGCKYLSQVNWPHLITIDLADNDISAQGCKYLSQANWKHLNRIDLVNPYTDISAQSCKYLSQANWPLLTRIDLSENSINAQGCKYLCLVNWTYLTQINLERNNINAQGCKYLIQANWAHLSYIDLSWNDIKNDIIYRVLLLSSHPNTKIQI